MKNKKNSVIDKDLYKHWLIDEIETLRHENAELRNRIDILKKQVRQSIGIKL